MPGRDENPAVFIQTAEINSFKNYQAMESGTTYAGMASAQREWVLLFKNDLHISVHGEKSFIDHVCASLEQKKKK
ncbi:hypothetical protein [Gimesia aquarii]|uniref:Uncharacterized protein n=1 Tax=Gimesia aquarii TaxID=2527964 RepID=A0A517WSN9_9PLAN|nr:hypothetical protein [Gimesia aquarii]QDU08261.1 hypothetical protein V202x_16270 [Gimesia aquarii]